MGAQTNGATALLETAHGGPPGQEAEKDLDVAAVAAFAEEDHKGLVIVEEPQTMP